MSWRLWSPPLLLFAAGSLGFACQSEPSAGTQTQWFEPCDTNADCGAQTSCVCAVCTRQCDGDDQCAEGICSSLISTIGRCGSGDDGRICLPEEETSKCSLSLSLNYGFGGDSGTDCESPSALLCEDFEDDFLEEYSIGSEGSDLETQLCHSAAGERSISHIARGEEGHGFVQMPLTEEVDSGSLHARFFAYVPSRQTLPDASGLFALRSAPRFYDDELRVFFKEGQRLSFTTGEDSTDSAENVFPLDSWFCVETKLEVGEKGSAEIFVDGASVIHLPEVSTLPASGPIALAQAFGPTFDSSLRYEVAVDNVVIDRIPIGCDTTRP